MDDRTTAIRQRGFWGKIRIDPQTLQCREWLPLNHHCLDVACVFEALSKLPNMRVRLDNSAGCKLLDAQIQRLAILALLHDAGKANLGFQEKVFDLKAPRAGHIRELAPLFEDASLNEALGRALEIETLAGWFDSPDSLDFFLLAAWSHHGSPIRFQQGD